MKQLFIINEYNIGTKYGVGTYTNQLVQCMAEDDEWNVNVVELLSPTVSEFIIYKKDDVRYFQIPIPVYYGNEKQYTKINSRYYKSVFYILAPYINEEQTIIHFNFVYGYELAILLKDIPTIKTLLTLHYTTWSFELLGDRVRIEKILSNPVSKSEEWIKRKFEQEKKFMEECCDQVVAIAQHSKEMILSLYGIDKKKVSLISNGIKDEFVKISEKEKKVTREKYNFSKDENIIIFAGRLEDVKGVFVLIDAFKLLLNLHPNTKLIIAGSGNFTKCLEVSNPIWQNIIITGFVEKHQLYELFSICDLGVVPSIHEEFGLVATEMMMNSLPLVAGKTTGLDEIVTDDCGIKVKINPDAKESVMDLVNAIDWVLDNRIQAISFARNARLRFLNNYELSVFEQKIKSQYNQLV